MRPWMLALFVLPLACDKRTDDDLRAMMGDVAANHVGKLETQQADLAKKNEELDGKITALTQRVTELETMLGATEARLEELAERPAPTPTAPPTPGKPDPNEVYKVTLGDAQTKGPDTALVTVVIFSDFQCPYCSRVNPTLKQLEADYGSDIRFAFKHNPLAFHNRALPAAIAAEAAGEQGKFWEMHDTLFDNARDLSDTNFVKWAKDLKLDVKQFERDIADSRLETRIKAQQSQGNTLGARGTPAFFINGRFLSGAQPVENFKKVIDEELAKAEKLVAAGTPRNGVYDQAIAAGKTSA